MTDYALRYNNDKPRYDLMILQNIVDSYCDRVETKLTHEQILAFNVLDMVANFQYDQHDSHLVDAMTYISDYWEDCVRVFEYGAKKYEDWNWLKGMKWSTNMASLTRHIMAVLQNNELIDPESNLSHFGHILCNLVMFRYSIDRYPEYNDLPKL